jgi:hypothetical protein
MGVNDNACFQNERGVFKSIAGKPVSLLQGGGLYRQVFSPADATQRYTSAGSGHILAT